MSKIKMQAEEASRKLAEEYGEPLWCKGTGMRNTHLLAIAPTVSNSRIAGCSAGIEPQPANVYTFNGAKGTFIVKNKELEKLLEERGFNTEKIWDQILVDGGSVQQLPNEILLDKDAKLRANAIHRKILNRSSFKKFNLLFFLLMKYKINRTKVPII